MKIFKILVLEDNRSDFILISHFISQAMGNQFQVKKAKTLLEALEVIRQDLFDIIITDLFLPDSVGLATLDAILEAAQKIPVLVLTGLDDDDIAKEAIQNGADDYLNKNVSNETELVRRIYYSLIRNNRALVKANAFL